MITRRHHSNDPHQLELQVEDSQKQTVSSSLNRTTLHQPVAISGPSRGIVRLSTTSVDVWHSKQASVHLCVRSHRLNHASCRCECGLLWTTRRPNEAACWPWRGGLAGAPTSGELSDIQCVPRGLTSCRESFRLDESTTKRPLRHVDRS